jgi:hypothetical protein
VLHQALNHLGRVRDRHRDFNDVDAAGKNCIDRSARFIQICGPNDRDNANVVDFADGTFDGHGTLLKFGKPQIDPCAD